MSKRSLLVAILAARPILGCAAGVGAAWAAYPDDNLEAVAHELTTTVGIAWPGRIVRFYQGVDGWSYQGAITGGPRTDQEISWSGISRYILSALEDRWDRPDLDLDAVTQLKAEWLAEMAIGGRPEQLPLHELRGICIESYVAYQLARVQLAAAKPL